MQFLPGAPQVDHMKNVLRLKTTLLLLAIGLSIGILFALQFQAPQTRVFNPVSPFIALQDSKTSLTADQADLKNSISTIRDEISKQQDSLKSTKKSTKGIVEQVEELKIIAGLTQLKQRGLVITLADSQSKDVTIDSIVHAADLRDIVNVLWGTKAQAISINDQRLVSTSSVDSIVNTILVNNTKIANPFIIKVVGDQSKMKQALLSGDNLKDILRRQKSNGLIYNVESSPEVTVTAFDGGFAIKHSKVKE